MEKHKVSQTNQSDNGFEFESIVDTDETAYLTREETRQIVTPYAFFVADELLGTPLAGPFRRGFALLIDLFFITLLTQVSSLILAAVAAYTFFRAGNRLKTKKSFNAVRIFLRLLVALLLFTVALGIVNKVTDDDIADYDFTVSSVISDDISDDSADPIELVALTAKSLFETKSIKQQVSQAVCEPAYECFKKLGEELVQDVLDIGLNRNITDGALEGYLGSLSEQLSAEQLNELSKHLQQYTETKRTTMNSPEQETIEQETIEQGLIEQESIKQTSTQQTSNMSDIKDSENDNQIIQSKGLISWFDNLVEELGLGFGWAAFYFSIFTAWWKGQTPGKKLMGIKVIKLDNKLLNLWESFGRYGGYAAGFATGLTGFLQVFWDPNRQAIHDKISETLVIDLRKPKVPFIKKNGGIA